MDLQRLPAPNTTHTKPQRASAPDYVDAVLDDLRKRSNKYHFNVLRQVGHRLQKFLHDRNIRIDEMIAGNLGEAEIIGGSESARTRELYQDALRSILRALCERGVTALAFDLCVLPAVDMQKHRDPRGLIGFPEALRGIYPEWLIPQRFLKAIRNNAEIPEQVRLEFRRFAEAEKNEINERSLSCYWGNIVTLVSGMGLKSLMELQGEEGARRLARFIESRNYTMKTSTVSHWRRVLRFFMGRKNALDLKDEFDNFAIKLPKPKRKPVLKEGASFRHNNSRHTVVGGVVMEAQIPTAALRQLLATPIKSKDFRSYQEDVLARFLAVIKDRPVECWARNYGSWVLHEPIEGHEESQLYAGDGVIRNNYRESIKKSRPDKPFPRWLADRLQGLWTVRRQHFTTRGDFDLRSETAPGLLSPGTPLWVDPRTGRRASQKQILEWARNGLLRAGMKSYVVERVTGYWFRRAVITTEAFNGAIFEASCETSGHSTKVALRDYVGQNMAHRVALERKIYWEPMGISGRIGSAQKPRHALAVTSAPAPAAMPSPDEWAHAEAACRRLKKSVETLRRWAKGGLIGAQEVEGRSLYSVLDIDKLRNSYVTPGVAGRASQVSDSYARRLCRDGKIPGLLRVGRKTYLIPVEVAHRLKEFARTVQSGMEANS